MALTRLTLSRQKKALVALNGTPTSISPLWETNTENFQIQIVDETGDPTDPYEVVDASGSDLRMILAAGVTGDLGDELENILAATFEAGWTWDAGEQAFTGELNLETAELAAFIGQAPSKDAILEINLMTGGVPETLLGARRGGTNVTVNANADEGISDPPEIIHDGDVVGEVAIQNGVGGVTIAANVVTVAGLALGGAPAHVYLFINAPAGSGAIFGSFVRGSATADAFSFVMSAVPANNNYTVTYVLTF